MTYTNRYNAIIHYFQRHPVNKTKIYCERHHIQPRSCGGSNDKENLVNLPAAWHYRVHCYLPFVMKERNDENGFRKMVHAWKRCLNSTKEKIDLMNINRECLEYKLLREADAKIQSKRSKEFRRKNPINGDKNPMFNAHWWKDPNDKTKSLSIKEGDPIPEGWIRGHWNSEHLRVEHIEFCKYCGAEKGKCKQPEICKHFQIFPTLINYFKFDSSKIGSESIFEEIEKCRSFISNLYVEKQLSLPQIANFVGYKSAPGHLCRILDFLKIPRRSHHEAQHLFLSKR